MADPSIILDIEPDWGTEPEVTYAFDTAIQPTPYLVEQRRPIQPTMVRVANYKFTETEEQFQRLRNTLLAAKAAQICVPLFNEPIFASSIVTGGSSITATTDLTYLWNIHNCSYIVLLDFSTGDSEMLGVTSVSGQLIRLATNIIGIWVATQTVIFPAMAAELVSMKQSFATDSIGSIEAEFSESVLGSEATGDWVGLEEQTCCEDNWVTPDLCSEYYNGTNGASLPTTIFTINHETDCSPVIQSNQAHFATSAPGGFNCSYYTWYGFTGAFDFHFTFTLTNCSPSNSTGWFYIYDYWGSIGFGVEWDLGGTKYYIAFGDDGFDQYDTTDNSGKMRITRDESNNIRAFVWNESLSRWEWNGDTSGLFLETDATIFGVVFEVITYNSIPVIDIGDFIVSAGCDFIEAIE